MFALRGADTGRNAGLPGVHGKIHRRGNGRTGGAGVKRRCRYIKHYRKHGREYKKMYGSRDQDCGQAGKEKQK